MLFSNTIVAGLVALGMFAPAALAQDTANCNHSQGEGINKDVTCRPVQGCPPAPGNALRLEGNEAYFPNITDGGISPIRTINIPEGGVGFQFVSNDGYFNCLAQFSESVSDTLLTLSPNGTFTTVWGDGSSRVGGCVKVPGDIAGQK